MPKISILWRSRKFHQSREVGFQSEACQGISLDFQLPVLMKHKSMRGRKPFKTKSIMPAQDNPGDGLRPNRPLPPELHFLVGVPDLREMDPGEFQTWEVNYKTLVQQHAALMREYGLDAGKILAWMEPALRVFEKSLREWDQAQEKEYQAVADAAEADYKLFKKTDEIVTKICEVKPFDPQVQEWKEFVDEWRKHMPKE